MKGNGQLGGLRFQFSELRLGELPCDHLRPRDHRGRARAAEIKGDFSGNCTRPDRLQPDMSIIVALEIDGRLARIR